MIHARVRGRSLGVIAVLALLPREAGAQIVRGTVREAATNTPVAGVVITLERASDAPPLQTGAAVNVLTDELGRYAVRAPAAGRYRIVAKRIGSQRFTADPFDLASGETRQLDIGLMPIMATLPTVTVAAVRLCVSRAEQAPRIAALWDEARAALQATAILQRSRAAGMRLTRYARVLDPHSLRVISEERTEHSTALAGQFVSISPDSLSKAGFWQQLPGDSVIFFAPDADVLVSDAFLRDHCFSVVDGRRDRPGQVGLSFGPAPGHFANDIRGIVWIHSRTFELQSVEFRYTNVPAVRFAERNGGEVHFVRTREGAWYVRQWYSRMPQIRRNLLPTTGKVSGAFNVPEVYRTIEEGGQVTPPATATTARRVSITGSVLDSTGAPVADAIVELAGTAFRTRTSLAGRFSLDDVPPGRYLVVSPSDAYRRFGIPAAEQDVELDAGVKELTLKASDMLGVGERLCRGLAPAAEIDGERAILRVVLTDSASRAPVAGAGLRARWTAYGPPVRGLRPVRSGSAHAATDSSGAAVLCNLPASTPVRLELVGEDDRGTPLGVQRLRPGEIAVIALRIQQP